MKFGRKWRLPAASFGLAVVLFTAGAIGSAPNRPSPAGGGGFASAAPVGAAYGRDLGATLVALQTRLREEPKDASAWASLGLGYVEQAKATVDPSYYPKAEGALRRSLKLDRRDNFLAPAGMSALAAARHDFAGAQKWAERGLEINPANATLYGALADALTQLGDYAAAMTATQRMLDVNPDANALARASYSWELRGDFGQARMLMQRALDSSSSANQKAFARYYLGELALNSGDASGAMAHYTAGHLAAPGYAALFEGKAKAQQALGDTEGALRNFAEAVARVPQPAYLIAYGELLESLGRTEEAKVQYKLFETEQKLFAANGVAADVEPTLFYADHGDPARALRLGEAGLKIRPFIEMQDAYAWALYRNGRHAEALMWQTKAMALGTTNALFEYHAGAIRAALGDEALSRGHFERALAINPAFHPLHAATARASLQQVAS